MSECKLSILVPFYNVGEFVTPLLDCFEKLTLPEEDYEIIFWNDGSADQSVDYVRRFVEKKVNRFFYESKKSGVSVTRNKLMDVAKGDYIWFVDADDLIYTEFVGSLLQLTSDLNLDMLCFGYEYLFEYGSTYPGEDALKETDVLDGVAFYKKNKMDGFVWSRIYRRSLINEYGVEFDAKLNVLEDYDFNQRLMIFAKRVKLYPLTVYQYRHRSNSLVHTSDADLLLTESFIDVFVKLRLFFESNNVPELVPYLYGRVYRSVNVRLRACAEVPKYILDKISESSGTFLKCRYGNFNIKIFAFCEYVMPLLTFRTLKIINSLKQRLS